MQQQIININQQLATLMRSCKWRDCQRKQYSIWAILPPAGYVFANSLEQPKQFTYIVTKFRRGVVRQEELSPEDKQILGKDCYVTDGIKLVLCGTRGELCMVKPEKFRQSYREVNGGEPYKIPRAWTEYIRVGEHAPSAKGTVIPSNYLGIFDAGWGVLHMNDPLSKGHHAGDVLVISNDGQSISTINNEVFALTFNQSVGGWARCGLIASEPLIRPITGEEVRSRYKFESISNSKISTDLSDKIELYKSIARMVQNIADDFILSNDKKTFTAWKKCRGGSDYDDKYWSASISEQGIIEFEYSDHNGFDHESKDVKSLDDTLVCTVGFKMGQTVKLREILD